MAILAKMVILTPKNTFFSGFSLLEFLNPVNRPCRFRVFPKVRKKVHFWQNHYFWNFTFFRLKVEITKSQEIRVCKSAMFFATCRNIPKRAKMAILLFFAYFWHVLFLGVLYRTRKTEKPVFSTFTGKKAQWEPIVFSKWAKITVLKTPFLTLFWRIWPLSFQKGVLKNPFFGAFSCMMLRKEHHKQEHAVFPQNAV